MEKNQLNFNNLREGYWERYWDNGDLYYKGNYINDIKVGYWEYYHFFNSIIYYKEFYLY